MKKAVVIVLLAGAQAAGGGCHAAASKPAVPEPQEQVSRRSPEDAIREGVVFLVKTQNADGSWGTGHVEGGIVLYSMVPGSHDAFRVATTALAVMALRDAGEKEAHAKGVEYLATQGYARRDDGALLYTVWGNIYALHALSIEMRDNPDPRLRTMAEWHLDRLRRYESYNGGWFYYDFAVHGQNPSEGSASFVNAAGLAALWEAKQSGLNVPMDVVERTIRRTEEMRMPGGAYLYGEYIKFYPRHPVNLIQGSVGRSQACNYALWLWNSKKVGPSEVRLGLDQLMDEKNHRYAEIGRKRPIPHEAWYATSGYFYYFGHYYAARSLEKLGPEARREYGARLAEYVLPLQEPDGSWWDYPMWDYHRPYGTAYALMILLRCR